MLLLLASVLAASPTTAIAPVAGDGLTADEIGRVEKAVRKAAEAVWPPVVNEAITVKRLESSPIACDSAAPECLVQIAVVLDADRVIAARASRKRLELRVVDVATAKVSARVVAALDVAKPEESITAAVAALTKPDAAHTHLVVKTSAGADVAVDGQSAGKGPTVELTKLAPGGHDVRVRLGAKENTAHVDVALGEATQVDLEPKLAALTPEGPPTHVAPLSTSSPPPPPAPPAPSLAPFVAAGGGVAVAVAGGVLAFVGAVPYLALSSSARELDALDQKARAGDVDVTDIKAQRAKYDQGVHDWNAWGEGVAFAGTALLAAGAGAAITGVALGILE